MLRIWAKCRASMQHGGETRREGMYVGVAVLRGINVGILAGVRRVVVPVWCAPESLGFVRRIVTTPESLGFVRRIVTTPAIR